MRLVSLKLTEDPEKLEALRLTGGLRQWGGTKAKPAGPECYIGRFNGVAYSFEPGQVIDLPENIAESLVQSSRIYANGSRKRTQWGTEYISAQDSDHEPVLEAVEAWEFGQQRPSAKAKARTVCPLCSVDQNTVEGLKEHVLECQGAEVEA